MNLKRMAEKARRRFSASPSDPSDRRRSARARLDYAVELQDAARKPADGAVNLTDLSGVGVGFASSKDFRVGDRLAVRVKTDGREVLTQATVRWARPEGVMTSYGVEFDGVSGLDRLRLELAARPGALSPGELGEMLLQFLAAALVAAVVVDWVTSDPGRMTTLLFSLPWLLSTATGVGLLWAASKT
ncbi:PilZ domain-containing protein [bacterium]|nr:MAG: PilZ domain-containing protein [bacterium]